MNSGRNVLFVPLPKAPTIRRLAYALAFWCAMGAIEYHRQWQSAIGRAWQIFFVCFALLMIVAFARLLVLRFRQARSHPQQLN